MDCNKNGNDYFGVFTVKSLPLFLSLLSYAVVFNDIVHILIASAREVNED